MIFKWIKDLFTDERRRGFMEYGSANNEDVMGTIEIVENERSGNRSKIEVLSVTGGMPYLLAKWQFNGWVDSSYIEWKEQPEKGKEQ